MQVRIHLAALVAAVGLLLGTACSEPNQSQEMEMPARPGEAPQGYEHPPGSMPEGDPVQRTDERRQPERPMERQRQPDDPQEGFQ